jgi:hypothetical protein
LLSLFWVTVFSQKSGYPDSRVNSMLNWVDEHNEQHLSDCLDTLLLAKRLVNNTKDAKLKIKVLLNLSTFSLSRLNNLEKCHSYLEEIRKMAMDNQRDPWLLMQYHNGRGVMFFYEQTNRIQAFKEFKKAQYLSEKYKLAKDPRILNNFALAYLSNNQADRALRLFKESSRLFSKLENGALSRRFILTNALNTGVCYIYLGREEMAEQQFRRVVTMARTSPELWDDFESLVYLGVFQEEQGKFEEAYITLQEAEKLIQFSRSFQMRSLLCESMELICNSRGEIKNAYDYAKKRRIYQDSLREVKLSEQAFALDYKFEAEKLRSEKIIAKLESSVEREGSRWRLSLLIATLLVVSSVAFFVIYRLNKQKELNRIKAENETLEKERIRQQAEIELLRKEEELISANVELNVRKNELSDLKSRLKSHLDKSHDPEFDDLKTFLKQAQKSEKRADQMKYLDHVLSYSKSTFYSNLRAAHPGLTDDELRLATFMRFNLSSEELAEVFNISMSSLMTKRYRLRKKLGIAKDQSLEQYILTF